MFPDTCVISQYFPGEDENYVNETDEKRRLRAIILSVLERETKSGSSLMLISDVVNALSNFRSDIPGIEPEAHIRTIKRLSSYFAPVFKQVKVKVIGDNDDEQSDDALQLVRLQAIDGVINDFVEDRLNRKIDIDSDWGMLLDKVLCKEQQSEDERETAARTEKIDAIKKMAQSCISVLTGGAGTGKTTTLVALCLNDTIERGRILVLAPTGKARVVLGSKLHKLGITHDAKTVFQYLRQSNHCDAKTWSYYLSGKSNIDVPDTVIIDECSMMTEEMFGALVESVSKAKRVIFVGDPNQLPPIGTGKPFFELVEKLKSCEGQAHYANLLVSNRQKVSGSTEGIRLDVEISKLFAESLSSQVSDDIFDLISQDSENIEFIHCSDIDNLPKAIEDVLKEAVGVTDIDSFDISLGGKPNNEWMNFGDAGLKPIYEKTLTFDDGTKVLPDFTIETASGTVYWEHLGMLRDYSYKKSWERKEKLYAENGIRKEKGNLITSEDEISGAINAQCIKQMIQERFGDR